jgi:hypothetical protein
MRSAARGRVFVGRCRGSCTCQGMRHDKIAWENSRCASLGVSGAEAAPPLGVTVGINGIDNVPLRCIAGLINTSERLAWRGERSSRAAEEAGVPKVSKNFCLCARRGYQGGGLGKRNGTFLLHLHVLQGCT